MKTKVQVTLDRAGRIALPKSLRAQFRLVPGDALQLERKGRQIVLRPIRRRTPLEKEQGVWVYQGEPTHASIPKLIDRQRKKRPRRKTPKARRKKFEERHHP